MNIYVHLLFIDIENWINDQSTVFFFLPNEIFQATVLVYPPPAGINALTLPSVITILIHVVSNSLP